MVRTLTLRSWRFRGWIYHGPSCLEFLSPADSNRYGRAVQQGHLQHPLPEITGSSLPPARHISAGTVIGTGKTVICEAEASLEVLEK